jgi:hypothetical protein
VQKLNMYELLLPANLGAFLLCQALRAAVPACNAALWCCSRAFSSSKPHSQQQQQQEAAELLAGLAFDEVYVERGGPYAGGSSKADSEQLQQVRTHAVVSQQQAA